MKSTEISQKLENARRRLTEIASEIGDLMVGSTDTKRLAALRRERDELRSSVDELEAAHTAAIRREAQADAARQADQREIQFEAFKELADEWASTGEELAGLMEKAAKCRVKLGLLAEQAEAAFPSGMVTEKVSFRFVDTTVNGSGFRLDVSAVLAGEAFRHGMANVELPGAQPPVAVLTYNRPAIEPAAKAFRRTRDYFTRLLRDRLDALKTVNKEAA